ncbi:hypothetical protein SAMN06265349_103318 [Flavobacterium resistens]|uniref:DUF3300 domain-containing protein n=1 Tax=Flavobacterium resistens TaxID=443612 RepID=A0A521DJE8_9FLAO|nr:DUF3300 domain-containing protein [Flavobacterium resistens]MRX68775.1 hypothetical protein [Flavobacterium resistens]SMO71827.1 hypothetical protein SAMN06265349_103318 [Flavobacterium resistens]
MKANLLILAFLTIGLSSCSAQNQATVYAKNSDISDNLDLRAVASMFGESSNLQDFERRLNDPKYQISNLDLNGDDQVDYLRVIESVENRTHVVIIQAVLDRDVYQDIATIDVERDNYNKVTVQVVGNTYLYGANYIYEPVYNVVPVIYGSFWVTNYRPYCSTWNWGYYPTYYTAWRPYPVYRYRNNVNICINANYSYNYVNYRRSYRAPILYESRRTYGYERMRPNYSFADRHVNTSNRYDLDQRRATSRNYNAYQNNDNPIRSNSGRPQYGENRVSDRNYNSTRNSDRNYNNTSRPAVNNRENNTPVTTPSRPDYSRNNPAVSVPRGNSENRNYADRPASQNNNPSRGYSENRGNSMNRPSVERTAPAQQAQPSRSYSENRGNSENRSYSSRPQSAPRSEAPQMRQESRSSEPQRENGSRGGGRRG